MTEQITIPRATWDAVREALERKLPGGKQTDDFESSRIGDYNQGWNDYRKAVKKMFKNINMNSSENSNPDAYLYSLEYGEKVVDTKVSIHQLNYPFGVAGADYLVRNDDGVSYVRQTKLYAALSRAQAAPAAGAPDAAYKLGRNAGLEEAVQMLQKTGATLPAKQEREGGNAVLTGVSISMAAIESLKDKTP